MLGINDHCYWDEETKKICIVLGGLERGDAKEYLNMYSVRAYWYSPYRRYGMWVAEADEAFISWKSIPKENFPPEFLMALFMEDIT